MVKLTMEPVTRIEGHAKITVHLDDAGNVEETRLHVMEFRGFEKFLTGRPVEELPRLVPRICGICDVQHHLAAAKAVDLRNLTCCIQNERNYELGIIHALPRTSLLLLSSTGFNHSRRNQKNQKRFPSY